MRWSLRSHLRQRWANDIDCCLSSGLRALIRARATMSDYFEDIRTFVAVVQAPGFAGASERLGLAKSAVSRRIQELEDRLGSRLLHRTTRQLSLTEAGTEF